MFGFGEKLDFRKISEERLKGAHLSVYFRWLFIGIIALLLGIQIYSGYVEESRHALYILVSYSLVNLALWRLTKRAYDPRYLRFLSALVDMGIVGYHLYVQTSLYDYASATAAASILFIPIFFLLYTFRLDRGVLIFLMLVSLTGFNGIYFYHYFQDPDLYTQSLSLSPIAHGFKTVYIAFIGFLCIYMQESIASFIKKLVDETEAKAMLDTGFKIEQEKNRYATQLIEHEKQLNAKLGKEIDARQLLAEQLHESKEQLNSILSNLLGIAYRCLPDSKWTMRFMGAQATSILGYAPERFLEGGDLSYASLIVPEDKELVDNDIRKALHNKTQFEIEYRVSHAEGRVIWLHESGQGVYDKEGALQYIDGIITDITKKKENEAALKETQEMVTTIINNMVGAVSRCLFDAQFTTLFYSDKIHAITGYPAEAFMSGEVVFASIIFPEDIEYVAEHIRQSVQRHEPYSVEFRIIHKQGHVVWVHENGQAVFDEQGNILYLDGTTTDITDKKKAEQSFKELTDFLPQTVYELDREGYIVFANRAADELFGKGEPDETGRVHVAQFFGQEDQERIKETSANPPKELKDRYVAEFTVQNKEGKRCPILVYSSPVVRDGELLGERGIIIDISERKKMEEDLKEAKEELEAINARLEQTVDERTRQLTEANTKLLQLQKENLQSQFEVLKQQVNPHFLFNSLNVLTSLIKIDADLAEKFTEQLSKVYRYVLENKEKDLVSLQTEMEFLQAYIFLVDIRFKGKLFVHIDFSEEEIEGEVVPLALQLLIENAIKHNTFSKKMPLEIHLSIENQMLCISNNLQSRDTRMVSTGVGLVNITKRYALVSDREPVFECTDKQYIAKIPLINSACAKNTCL